MRVPYTDMVANYMDTPHRRLFDLREDGLSEIPWLGWYFYSSAKPDLPLHRHFGCLEVHFRERGEQIFRVADQLYHLRGGELFVTRPDEPHSSGGYASGPGIMYWLAVKVPKPGRPLLGLSSTDSRLLVDRFLRLPDRHFKAIRGVKPLFDQLIQLHDDPDAFLRKSRMKATMIRLLLAILESSARHTAQTQPSQRMARVIQTIRERPQGEYRLRDLARQTHLSLSRFTGRFKAETGVSPWQFILETKIEAAQKRLRAGREPITHIAIDLGFASSQYFATVFKRIAGQTPRDYRKDTGSRRPSTRVNDGQG
jgi:AraC-like DNA-binding protein